MAKARKNPAAVALGRKGGQVRSDRKTAAARRNAQKAGRPAKFQPLDRVVIGAKAPANVRNRIGTIVDHRGPGLFGVRFDGVPDVWPVRSWWLERAPE